MWPQTKDKPHIHHQPPKHLASTLNYKLKSSHGTEGYVSNSHDCSTSVRFHITCDVYIFSAICWNMCVYQYVGITHFPTYFSQIKWTFPKLNQASLHFSAVTLYTQNVIFKAWKRSTRMHLFIQSIYVKVFWDTVLFWFTQSLFGNVFFSYLHIWMTFVNSYTVCSFSYGRTAAEFFYYIVLLLWWKN